MLGPSKCRSLLPLPVRAHTFNYITMYFKLLLVGTFALCIVANPIPQQAQQAQQLQQQQQQQIPQEQILAYLQQLQAQQQQQTQIFQQKQQPKVFRQAQLPQQSQPQIQGQQLPQQPPQSLLGVVYSSAADASKTTFSGYGISYNF